MPFQLYFGVLKEDYNAVILEFFAGLLVLVLRGSHVECVKLPFG